MSIPGPAYRIETSRLVLRCWNPVDAPLLDCAIAANLDHLRPWMPWIHDEPKDLQQRIELLRGFRSQFDRGENFTYGIFSPDETKVLGGTGLHSRVGQDAIEIGYWIHVDAINQGLATEVAAALTKVAFEIHHLERVEIHCDPQNLRSAAVPRKLGFVQEAILRRRVADPTGQKQDSMIWSMFADAYPESAIKKADIAAFDALQRRLL